MTTAIRYSHLLKTFQLKHLQLKNRIVKPAQWTLFAEEDGSIGDRILAHYETLARGGVGMIVFEESVVDFPLGASQMPHVRVDDDRFIPGLQRLVKAVQQHDCPILMQLTHAGPAFDPGTSGLVPVAPSRLNPPVEDDFHVARALNRAEILELIEAFAQAARRAQEAGFDGVEFNMAHYGLLNAFLSRVQNHRDDEYGPQTLENRSNLACAILRRTRVVVGENFVLAVRLNGREWGHPAGTDVEEACDFARRFEASGADLLQVSAYGYGPFALAVLPDLVVYPQPSPQTVEFAHRREDGYLIPEAEEIRAAVSIPVSGVGRLNPELGDRLLAEDRIDLVCLGRRLLADPELPGKLHSGRELEIRPCLGCNYCLHVERQLQPVQCRMNPFLSHEHRMILHAATRPKRVLIVGAGPAGLEAARLAALRGHRVAVYDRSHLFGGSMPLVALLKGTETDDVSQAIDYYRRELERLEVEIFLGVDLIPDQILLMRPDAVVVATGGRPEPVTLDVEAGGRLIGSDELKRQAIRWMRWLGLKTVRRLSRWFMPVGKQVVVIGGDVAGLELAEFLAKHGRQVTLVEPSLKWGEGMLSPWLERLLPWMDQVGIERHLGAHPERVTRQGLEITTLGGDRQLLRARHVIYIQRTLPMPDLYQALEGEIGECYWIGDAAPGSPAYLHGAIRQGAEVGLRI